MAIDSFSLDLNVFIVDLPLHVTTNVVTCRLARLKCLNFTSYSRAESQEELSNLWPRGGGGGWFGTKGCNSG